jgi:hypothetical protein
MAASEIRDWAMSFHFVVLDILLSMLQQCAKLSEIQPSKRTEKSSLVQSF